MDVFDIVEYSGFRIHPLDAMKFPRFNLFRELRIKNSFVISGKTFVVSDKALLFSANLCCFRQSFVIS